MDIDGSAIDQNIGLLLSYVVHKRKTYPKQILEHRKTKVTNEINNLLAAKVDLGNDIAKMEIKLLCDETKKLISRRSVPKQPYNYDALQEAQRNLSEIENFLNFYEDLEITHRSL